MIKSAIASLIAAYALLSQMKVEFYDKLYDVDLLEEYDFIVVGSGSSGSIIASRLSEIENTTVLVLEAGNSGRGNANVDIPYFTRNLQKTDNDWNYVTEPLKHANMQSIPYPRGKIGGGTGTFNYMHYVRGSKEDYTSWEELGAEGWGPNDVFKYFQKVENASDPDLSESIGKRGKVPLSRGYHKKDLYSLFADVANELNISVADYFQNGGITQGLSLFTRNMWKGIRQSSALTYLWPASDRKKSSLHLAFNANVHKVLLTKDKNKNKAYGVEFQHTDKPRRVLARREIIPEEHLKSVRIEVNVNLPGVGLNLQDHPYVSLDYYGAKFPNNLTLTNKKVLQEFPEYLLNGESALNNALPVAGTMFLNANYRNISMEPSFVQLVIVALQSSKIMLSKAFRKEIREARMFRNRVLNHFSIAVGITQPKSKGTVSLSSNDPQQNPLIDLNLFSDPEDMNMLLSGFRLIEEMEYTETFKENQIKLVLQPFCNVSENNILPRSSYFYECLTKTKVQTFCHACCTTKMGRESDRYSVVDPRLRVYGVEGLRIVDASVMPHIVTGNPQATCFMIAEKAAEMIREDWNF